MFIETIELATDEFMEGERKSMRGQRHIAEYVSKYCSETLIEMKLHQFKPITTYDGPATTFYRVQRLTIMRCLLKESFLKSLSASFPYKH